MCTGGGWQDQIGGLLPGVKLIETKPGCDQTPTCRPLPFVSGGASPLAARCLLYFTGQKRMARNILNNVVDRYVSRAGDVRAVVDGLKRGARRMAAALEAQDAAAFAAGVREYWSLKKRIAPGSTNPAIDALLARVEKETVAESAA